MTNEQEKQWLKEADKFISETSAGKAYGLCDKLQLPMHEARGIYIFAKQSSQAIIDAKDKEIAELQRRVAELEKDAERYQELLYAVERKFPNESRHDTALRYIKNTEKSALQPASAAITKEQGE